MTWKRIDCEIHHSAARCCLLVLRQLSLFSCFNRESWKPLVYGTYTRVVVWNRSYVLLRLDADFWFFCGRFLSWDWVVRFLLLSCWLAAAGFVNFDVRAFLFESKRPWYVGSKKYTGSWGFCVVFWFVTTICYVWLPSKHLTLDLIWTSNFFFSEGLAIIKTRRTE